MGDDWKLDFPPPPPIIAELVREKLVITAPLRLKSLGEHRFVRALRGIPR